MREGEGERKGGGREKKREKRGGEGRKSHDKNEGEGKNGKAMHNLLVAHTLFFLTGFPTLAREMNLVTCCCCPPNTV